MENKNIQNREKDLLYQLGGFSKKMAENYHLENLSEFILHDLCSDQVFKIRKAAYLVNNPDFYCLKGVAGYFHPEKFNAQNSWEDQKQFTAHMKQSNFNQKVRDINESFYDLKKDFLEKETIQKLVDHFEINDPLYHVWKMKYDNQGLFIFERPDDQKILDDHLLDFLHHFSFCSVF